MLGSVVFISKLCPVIVQKVHFYICVNCFYLEKKKCLFYFSFFKTVFIDSCPDEKR